MASLSLTFPEKDQPTVIALTLLAGIATVVGTLVAAIALTVADPRIRIN